MRAAELVSLAASHGVDLTSAPPAPRPRWAPAQVLAARDRIPVLCFAAACFVVGDRANIWALHHALLIEGCRLRRAQRWPCQVVGVNGALGFYVENLALLVLEEAVHPHLFAYAPALYGLHLGVTDIVWHRALAGRYGCLRAVWHGWIRTAARIIQAA